MSRISIPIGATEQGPHDEFVRRLDLKPSERRIVLDTLKGMPEGQRCRGMFFAGVTRVLGARPGGAGAIYDELGIDPPRMPFGLYPHIGFYKLCFWAANHLYPNSGVREAMGQLAASFYPIFKTSMVGKTMAPLMGSTPGQILSRLADAYRLCVPNNTHELEMLDERSARWTCTVEPGECYPDIFRGIIVGTMGAQGIAEPAVELLERDEVPGRQSCVFEVRWSPA